MSYEDNYTESVELDLDQITEAQKIVITTLLRAGELTTRSTIVAALEKDVAEYLDEVDGQPNIPWLDGVRYVIHLIKGMKVIHE
tara:strand:+ start:1998 stop:2249 length:252 start_codon:yes stop_codon:yes gene_type:complete